MVNQEQSEIVKWIFAEVLSGSSTTQIAKALNARGISTKRGGRWTGHTINGMIKNEKYTGDVIFQKTYSDDTFAFLEEMPAAVTEYSEALARRLVKRITIFDEKIVVELKSSLQMEVEE